MTDDLQKITDRTPEDDETVEIVLKEAVKPPVKTKKIEGINWVFPFMTCQNGELTSSSHCECKVEAPAFVGDDCCYISNEADPKCPTLCPLYIQKQVFAPFETIYIIRNQEHQYGREQCK